MSAEPEQLLPKTLLDQSSLLGKEYLWRISDIPAVIDAAEAADLVSIGGQLMFDVPNGGTGECCWVEVDTYGGLSDALSWPDRVRLAASAARQQFNEIQQRYDFEAEIRDSFRSHVSAFEASGHSIAEAMWFAWYLESELSHSNSTIT